MTTNTMVMNGKKLNRKDMVMITDKMTIQEKKLKNIRKILWICFGGFSGIILLFFLPVSIVFTTGDILDTINKYKQIRILYFITFCCLMLVFLICITSNSELQSGRINESDCAHKTGS